MGLVAAYEVRKGRASRRERRHVHIVHRRALAREADVAAKLVDDALVPIPSAQWGDYRGVIPVDHLNQVGMGIAPRSYSATEFFHDEFTRLASLGY